MVQRLYSGGQRREGLGRVSELRRNGVQGFQTVRPMRGRRLDIYTRPEELAVAGVQPLYGLRMPRQTTNAGIHLIAGKDAPASIPSTLRDKG